MICFYFSSGCLYKFMFGFQNFDYDVPQCSFVCIYPTWGSLSSWICELQFGIEFEKLPAGISLHSFLPYFLSPVFLGLMCVRWIDTVLWVTEPLIPFFQYSFLLYFSSLHWSIFKLINSFFFSINLPSNKFFIPPTIFFKFLHFEMVFRSKDNFKNVQRGSMYTSPNFSQW